MQKNGSRWLARAGLLLALAAAGPVCLGAAEKAGEAPRIGSLELKAIPGELQVSFHLEDGFDERILTKLDSGLEVVFKHVVQVRRKRSLWFDRNVATKQVETSAILDGLTRQYTLRRKINRALVEALTTSDVDEMRDFMTRTEKLILDLPEKLPLDGRTEVRVRSTLETRFFLFFPYAHQTAWVRLQLNPPRAIEDRDAD